MENTIVINEDRGTVNKIRNWYKEKLIDTGKAAAYEERIDKNVELQKKIIKVAGTVATVILIFIPADGPVGEIATILATPALVKLVELRGEMMKKAIIGTKRKIEADFIKADGSSKNISVPDYNIVKDFADAKKYAQDLEQSTKSMRV